MTGSEAPEATDAPITHGDVQDAASGRSAANGGIVERLTTMEATHE